SLSACPIALSSLLYIIAYVIITFFIFFSKDLFWFMGAFLFGPFLSAIFICIAEIINAFILFYIARLLGRHYVEKKLPGGYRKLDHKLGKISLFWLFVLRAAPLIPHRFLDLASGLTTLRFSKYLIAVIFGTPIKIFWIQYIIYSVGKSIFNSPTVLMEYFLSHKILLFLSFGYIILIIMAVVKMCRRD
ncbi:MAG: VTT domain-containing protein, partial [Candidatus Omnitrophota bacterium]